MDIIKYFDELNLNQIESYIKDGQEENLSLDFKTLTDSSLSKRDDRKNLAIALSGFANSEGGIIVWGVDARPNSDGVDVASELKEIENLPPASFKAQPLYRSSC
jgi:predicted HTH transcriptional regulator